MENSFNISVFVLLVVSSGCAAPVSNTEIITASSSEPDIFYGDSSQINLNNISVINDTELFLAVEEKASNLSERSLIFINKKLKTLRRIPLKNRYQGYQAFMPQSAPETHRWIIDDKMPQKFRKEKSPDVQKPVKNQLFEPRRDIKRPQLPSLYRFVYPEQPKRNKSCIYEEHQKIKSNANKSEQFENQNLKYNAKPIFKMFDLKSMNVYNDDKNIPNKLSTISPEYHSKNLVITSFTNRKTKSSNKTSDRKGCGFLKPSWLHRLTFNKNLEEKSDFSGVSNKESYTDILFSDEKLDRYIKEALSELQTEMQNSDDEGDGKDVQRVQQEKNKNFYETGEKKLEELLAELKDV